MGKSGLVPHEFTLSIFGVNWDVSCKIWANEFFTKCYRNAHDHDDDHHDDDHHDDDYHDDDHHDDVHHDDALLQENVIYDLKLKIKIQIKLYLQTKIWRCEAPVQNINAGRQSTSIMMILIYCENITLMS